MTEQKPSYQRPNKITVSLKVNVSEKPTEKEQAEWDMFFQKLATPR